MNPSLDRSVRLSSKPAARSRPNKQTDEQTAHQPAQQVGDNTLFSTQSDDADYDDHCRYSSTNICNARFKPDSVANSVPCESARVVLSCLHLSLSEHHRRKRTAARKNPSTRYKYKSHRWLNRGCSLIVRSSERVTLREAL